jgi:hypothetical protein
MAIQNKAIRDAAGGFLKNLNTIPSFGKNMVSIVEAFGNVAYSHLKYVNSKNKSGSPPKQATRIEPYEPLNLSLERKRFTMSCFGIQSLLKIIVAKAAEVTWSHVFIYGDF